MMKIQTGMELMGDVKPVDGNHVDFVIDDRIMFSVRIGRDGRSLEVSACNTCRIDGVLYDSTLYVAPNASNVVTVRTRPYGE